MGCYHMYKLDVVMVGLHGLLRKDLEHVNGGDMGSQHRFMIDRTASVMVRWGRLESARRPAREIWWLVPVATTGCPVPWLPCQYMRLIHRQVLLATA